LEHLGLRATVFEGEGGINMGFDFSSIGKQVKGSSASNSVLKVMTIAGAVGGVAGFALSEVIQNPDSPTFFDCELESCTSGDLIRQTAVWFMLIIVGLGLALSASQGVREKNVEKSKTNIFTSLPALIIGGLIAGAIAQKIYEVMLEDSDSFVVPRTIAWGVVGGLGGVAVGIGFRSAIRLRNCALGGLGGGLIGGLLFDQLSSDGSASLSRFIGIVLIGLLMGLFVGLLDVASTDFYLELVSGEARGMQFVLFDQTSVIGCARTVAVTLTKDPLITEQHVRATKTANGLSVECMRGATPVLINGQQTQNGVLPVGGTLQIGNTVLMLGRKKSGAVNTTSANYQTPHPNVASTPPVNPVRQPPPPAQPAPARARPTIQMPNKSNQ